MQEPRIISARDGTGLAMKTGFGVLAWILEIFDRLFSLRQLLIFSKARARAKLCVIF